MQMNCPVCHATFPLESALQHEAGREVMSMLAGMQPELARALLHYIGYFRPAKQQLGWGRALKLMQEVINLDGSAPGPASLTAALAEASRALDDKRQQPGWKPMGNHNYLRRVLDSVQAGLDTSNPPALAQSGVAGLHGTVTPRSRAGVALASMEALKQ